MKQTRSIMGMPITIEVIDEQIRENDIEAVFEYFNFIDSTFSTYKRNSEISKYNRGELSLFQTSVDLREILQLAEETKKETKGFFNIDTGNGIDPSGIVKGWAIHNATNILKYQGFNNLLIDAGGDMQAFGKNRKNEVWTIGIRNPFNKDEIIKVIVLNNKGIATSGTYIRGQHIYNPHNKNQEITDIASLTVIGPNVYEADRFATAAFAMGKKGIEFIEKQEGLEGYMIDKDGIATFTTQFERYVL